MKKIYPFLCLALFSTCTYGQLVVDNTIPAAQVVEDVFLANGIFVSNITSSGFSNQVGTFNGANCNLNMSSGIILATGDVAGAVGPNNSSSFSLGIENMNASDPDIDDLDQFSHNDAVVVQFDFIATGDSLAFEYIFASDEYPEYSGAGCGDVSDVFGFFISGPGITGPFTNNARNIALIPGTNEFVSIHNLNAGCLSTAVTGDADCHHCEFYVNNGDGMTEPFLSDDHYIQYDGFTIPMFATIGSLQIGEIYHIKLVVADVSDSYFDTAVFLKGDGFVQLCSPEVNLMPDQCMISSLHADVEYTEECGTITMNNQSEINIATSGCYYEMGDGNLTSACAGITSYTYAESGTYTIKLAYLVDGFVAKYTVANLLVSDTPPVTPIITQNGNMLEVSNWDGYSSLQWFLDGGPLSGATSNTFVITEEGNYTVRANNGCPVTSAEFLAIGISENLVKTELTIFPNPAEGSATIVLPAGSNTLQLYNMEGRLVNALQVKNQKSITLNASSGLYSIRVLDESGNPISNKTWIVK